MRRKELTAYHESGHALVLQFTEKSEPLHKITIIPRHGLSGGNNATSRRRIVTPRAGQIARHAGRFDGRRAAEELVFNDLTTGASNDLKEATRLARLMVCNWGMSARLGPQTFGAQEELMFLGREVARNQDFSEDTARRIDEEVNALLREALATARNILETHRAKLDLIAELLLERETLDGRDIEEIAKHGRLLSDEERAEAEDAAASPEKSSEPAPAG